MDTFSLLFYTFAFVLVSFFEPGKAVLPGLARIDTGHSSFLAFCLEQVESDARERLRHWSPSNVALLPHLALDSLLYLASV